MVDANGSAPALESPDELVGRKGFTVGRVLAIIAVISMVIFWIWIFSGAPAKENPDKLQDPAYVESLADRCQALRDDLEELPNAADIETAPERAVVLDEANVLVDEFIDDLEAGAPTSGDAAVTIEGWIADWRIYLADREDFADRLRTDSNAQLLISQSALGDAVDRTILEFSKTNEIPACATPGDVG